MWISLCVVYCMSCYASSLGKPMGVVFQHSIERLREEPIVRREASTRGTESYRRTRKEGRSRPQRKKRPDGSKVEAAVWKRLDEKSHKEHRGCKLKSSNSAGRQVAEEGKEILRRIWIADVIKKRSKRSLQRSCESST